MGLTRLPTDAYQRWKEMAAALLEIDAGYSAFFTKTALRRNGWVARIFEATFKGPAAAHFTTVATRYQVGSLVCVNVDANEDVGYVFPAEISSLAALRDVYFVPAYAILETTGQFAIVSDADYYWGIAGTRDFVEEVSAFPGAENIAEFRASAQRYTRPSSLHHHMGLNLLQYADVCDLA
jgi:hypothetical protein